MLCCMLLPASAASMAMTMHSNSHLLNLGTLHKI